jgi:hypothetical protein
MLVDWGFAAKKDSDDLKKVRGTAMTASQKTLAHMVDAMPSAETIEPQFMAQRELAYLYTEADELESAVKTLLVILSPALMRSLKQQMAAARASPARSARGGAKYVLWEGWQALLPADLLTLCEAHDYTGVMDWLLSKDRLLLWEAERLATGTGTSAPDAE